MVKTGVPSGVERAIVQPISTRELQPGAQEPGARSSCFAVGLPRNTAFPIPCCDEVGDSEEASDG
jgi:hypothetical protein